MAVERTLSIIKPDATRRNITGKVIDRLESGGLRIVAQRLSALRDVMVGVARNREVMGATNPAEADEGTIRKDFAESIEANSVHGSDAPETASQEIAFFFSDDEIVG